jgi:hypothetical protein
MSCVQQHLERRWRVNKKRGRKSRSLTLRLDPALHETLSDTAPRLGLDLSGLIRLMLRRSLPHFLVEARLLEVQAEEGSELFAAWRRDNPSRPVREFWDDYYRHQQTQWWRDVAQFPGHDPRFGIDEAFAGGGVFGARSEAKKEKPS